MKMQKKIPSVLHQVWGGYDPISERLASYLSQNAAFCKENYYEHVFWRLINEREVITKTDGLEYQLENIEQLFPDRRVSEMIADPRLHYVMAGQENTGKDDK